MARRSGENWFIGCMNSGKSRTFDVPLEFLDHGSKYIAHIYSDDQNVATRTHVRVKCLKADSSTVLKMVVSAKGGQAVKIVPEQVMSLDYALQNCRALLWATTQQFTMEWLVK